VGAYSVRVTNAAKCVGRDTIVITPGINPTVNLGPDTTVCAGYAVTLDAGNPGSTYLYSTGSTTQTLSVIPAGTYTVLVTNPQGCVGRDTITISVIPLASVSAISATRAGLSVTFTSDAQNTGFYQWSFGDNTTDNTPSPVHSYAANGTYTVRLIVGNQCGNDTVLSTVTVSGVGTGTVSLGKEELLLYPNPASSLITLDNRSGLKMQSVTVLNSLGAVVIRQDGISAKKETLDISALPAGSYMLRIQTDGGSVMRRLQISK
jgi:PKD repeat protein